MKTLIYIVLLIIIVAGGFFLWRNMAESPTITEDPSSEPTTQEQQLSEVADEQPDEDQQDKGQSTIGTSVDGRDIVAYHFGTGETELLFVGGMHGGYSWNTALVAYQLIDYLNENPDAVPENERVTVIPVLNPDGLYTVTGKEGRFTASDVPSSEEATIPGRFNANNVDLNRNFDCDWQAQATWQDKTVSGGTGVFSEPESQALRQYVQTNSPDAVVVWYSAVGGVFASNCHTGILPETSTITNVYADASGYPAYENFNFYEVTGDAVNWLAKSNIPAISVLLTNHTDTEWSKNIGGIEALLEHYAQE